jgi:threonine/homoserine/homoserine lactone efflux protein
MDLSHLVAFNIALLVAIASLGPSLILPTRSALVGGRVAGVATAAGLACIAAVWTLLSRWVCACWSSVR